MSLSEQSNYKRDMIINLTTNHIDRILVKKKCYWSMLTDLSPRQLLLPLMHFQTTELMQLLITANARVVRMKLRMEKISLYKDKRNQMKLIITSTSSTQTL